ncbi:MAG: toluene monooxygenase system protein, partial [Actinomycetota bacterium]|nr:toluene monooxygenase system protein [Actinomycetota bacterium]
MPLRRDEWLDLARKVDWTFSYVDEREVYPEEVSGAPWLAHSAWENWTESYRTSYREYVENQRAKDDSVMAVRDALNKPRLNAGLDPGWLELVKFHSGVLALGEYAAVPAELRMARFGRDSAWRTMSLLGALDEIRHTQIPLLINHDLLRHDARFDWTHKAYHTNQWVILAVRHLFEDMFVAATAVDTALQLNFVFETGFSNLQFMALAALADRADHHLFEKALTSIQTDEARHAQIGHPVLRTLLEEGFRDEAQFLLDKMWWRSWRGMLALTGPAMEYLTPLAARTRSFKEFMEEWVIDQFMKNLEDFGLDRPWFWDTFV